MAHLFTILLSGLVSFLIAKFNAKHEIKKAMIPINHESQKILSDAFSKCMSATEAYLNAQVQIRHTEAISSVAYLITIAPKELQTLLIELDEALCHKDNIQIRRIRSEVLVLFSDTIQNSNTNSNKEYKKQG